MPIERALFHGLPVTAAVKNPFSRILLRSNYKGADSTNTGTTGWYTGREHGCQYGLNGDQLKRTCGPPGSPRVPPVFHAREAVDQRDSPAPLSRARAYLSGTGTRRVVFGAV